MYLQYLYPAPKTFTEDECERFVFGARVVGRVSGLSAEAAERARFLWNRFSCAASELELIPGGEGFRMDIGDGSDCALEPGDRYARGSRNGAMAAGRAECAAGCYRRYADHSAVDAAAWVTARRG